MQVTFDPQIPEWDNSFEVILEVLYRKVREATRGSKTFQYPEEKKPKGIPPVAASEEGKAQTQ